MAVLFDLDLTLVDSTVAASLRRQRDWPAVYRTIPSFSLYDGIDALLKDLADREIPVCVVTSAPASYCGRVLSHFGITCHSTVCYHDTQQHKPNPAPILRALDLLEVTSSKAVAVGDEARDVVAGRAASVTTIAALWGSVDAAAVLAERPDVVCRTPAELRIHLQSIF